MKRKYSSVFWILILFISATTTWKIAESRRQHLQLVNNGFDGLVVKISEYVSQDHCNQVIHGIRNVMREFSSEMFNATEGRAFIREVTVSLPKSWKTQSLACSFIEPVVSASPSIKAHISITAPHPLFGNKPWTQQSQGCGRPGDYIQMGYDSLRSKSPESHRRVAKELLGEWVKYRWGVFEEIGHEGDPLYPSRFRDPNSNQVRPNQCPMPEQSTPFCLVRDHNPEAPNKHNTLCAGRPAWNIIMQSEDFASNRNPPTNLSISQDVAFKFVQESAPRIVLAVEDTAVMNIQRRWEFLRKAVRRTVVYDVPDGAHMALVVFNSVAQTVAPLSKMDAVSDVRQRIGSSLPRNPSTVQESHKCVLCGLQKAIQALDDGGMGTAGATIILVTTGAGTATHNDMAEMVRLVKTRGVRVIPILYPLTDRAGSGPATPTNRLEPLVAASEGEETQTFTVMDEGVGNDSKVSMMVSLMDALLSAMRVSSQTEGESSILIHSESYPGGVTPLASGTFTLDDSLGKDVRFSIYYYDLNHVGNTIQLTTPSGEVLNSVNMQEEDGDANVIFVNIPDAERGIWRYKVENRADSHQGLHIQVTAQTNPNRQLNVKLWTSSGGAPLNASDPSKPVMLYAEVKDGLSAVLDGKVVAKLQRLGTNATGSFYEPIFIELLDNGIGDPDITKNDGVYSRYLPQSQTFPGNYELSVMVDHNNGLAKMASIDALSKRPRLYGSHRTQSCCGSVINYDNLKNVSPFRREIKYGVVSVVDAGPERDLIPPNRILDLRASVNNTSREVTLRWTAPGDDYDWGRAHHYEAVVAESWGMAKAFNGKKISGLPLPLSASLEQTFKTQINMYDQFLYISIRAKDSAGNMGGVSNIGVIWIPHPPTTPSPVPTPEFEATKVIPTDPIGSGLTQSVGVAGFTLEDMAIVVGSLGGFLIIVAVLTTFCYCHVSHRRKQQHKKDTEKLEANRSVIIKSNSSIMMDQEDSRDSADSAVKDAETLKDVRPLSPVQSWAASKLLAEHERRFSVSSGPIIDANMATHYGQNIQDPFPDVTLTSGTHSYPSSQTPSTTHSDPPAYQPHYSGEAYAPYPYQYHANFAHEELPPYTPGLSSQSSQASTVYTHELPQPNEIPYPVEGTSYSTDMPAFVGDATTFSAPPPSMFVSYPEDTGRPQPQPQAAPRVKVPPPVAPKPQCRAPAPVPTPTVPCSSSEPKRRNVTQV